LGSENTEIADWLIKLTAQESDWSFGMCCNYLRNVNDFEWSYKRVYRIYCMHNKLIDGRQYCLLNVLDDYRREGLAIEAVFSLLRLGVIRTLSQLLEWRDKLSIICCDYGLELMSHEFTSWAKQQGIRIEYIQTW
jgi:putative transposase